LEDLRALIRALLGLHGLVRLPPAYCRRPESNRLAKHEFYQRSLAPLVCHLHPDSICLLAALCLESFIVGNYELLELHRESLCKQVDRVLLNPYMVDIRDDFMLLVVEKLVNMEWEEAPPFESVSLDSPLMRLPAG
jgi:hypothetical protein